MIVQKRFKFFSEAFDFSEKVNGKIDFTTNVDDGQVFIVYWDDETPQKDVTLSFVDMWEHYRVQYKDSNTHTEELYSIEALGFLKAIRLLYPEHITEINKEIAITLTNLTMKILGE